MSGTACDDSGTFSAMMSWNTVIDSNTVITAEIQRQHSTVQLLHTTRCYCPDGCHQMRQFVQFQYSIHPFNLVTLKTDRSEVLNLSPCEINVLAKFELLVAVCQVL